MRMQKTSFPKFRQLRSRYDLKGLLGLLVASSIAAGTSVLIGCTSLSQREGAREFTVENRWVRSTLVKEHLGYRRLNRMSPIVLPGRVIQGNSIDGIVAYDRSNGAEIWRLNIENGVEGGASVDGEFLYFGASDGQFYCVSLADGKPVWTFPVRAETLAAPSIVDGVVYFQSGADIVYALEAKTGRQLWVYNRQVSTNLSIRATTRPIVQGENVYAGFSDGFIASIRKSDGGLIWERRIGHGNRFRDVDSTPVFDGNALFVASYDGALYSLNAETGEINWTVESGAYVPVTIAGDRLYYSTVDGRILVLDKQSGKELKSIEVKNGIATQPVLFKNFLVYGESEGDLVFSDLESGQVRARFAPGHGLMAAPVVIDSTGETYFVSNGANLYSMIAGYQRLGARLPWQKDLSR